MHDQSPLSLFALLSAELGAQLAPLQATKATLVDVSHVLEELVLSQRLPAVIFTGFQESSHWREETVRYRELANVAHQICIFAGGELPAEDDQRQIHVRLRGPDPLRQEWFLLVLTQSFAAVLCGRDQQAPAPSESDRTFDTLWSFSPAIITQTLTLLHSVVARERPDRLPDLEDAIRRFPPPSPDADLITRFTTWLIDDLTRQHQARQHLERKLAYASRLSALGQVVSSVAHELNNPLQSILGFASLVIDEPRLDAPTRTDIQHIIDAAQRAQVIVHELLHLARPVTDGFVATNLSELLTHTLVFVRADLQRHGIALSITAPPNLPPIQANPARFQQLLINLLTNALQALARHPGPRQIHLEVALASPEEVELVITDTGPGIPLELQERIFEPFFTTKPVGEGTGLGLGIVRTIVSEHKGRISVRSVPGRGAAFHLRFPITAPGSVASRTPALAPGQGGVLVIDDDPQVIHLLERVLSRTGYYVQAERDPMAALERLLQDSYDVIILDLMMPQMSGMELYERLMQRSPALARRLLFITGDATRSASRAFLDGTGQPYLLKPFTAQQLLAAVRRLHPGFEAGGAGE